MASIIKADTLQSTTANVFILNSSGTEYARFDATGVFQLTNPTTFPAGTAALPSITATGDTNTGIFFPAADTIAFSEGGAEAMRIDSSGNVGIGTSSPANGKLVITGNSVTTAQGIRLTGDTADARFICESATLGAGILGTFSNHAQLFYTNSTERMRIDSSGNSLVGLTSGNADAKVSINAGSTDSSPCIDFRKGSATTTTSQVFARFWASGGSVATGSITSNGISVATFTGYSDRRLKENIVNLPSQLANIMALRPVEFDFKGYENGEGHQIGFIAQEVQEIYPDLVGEGDDGMLTLSDMNKNDARLIKAIQEQQALITALTATTTSQTEAITALTARIAALESTP